MSGSPSWRMIEGSVLGLILPENQKETDHFGAPPILRQTQVDKGHDATSLVASALSAGKPLRTMAHGDQGTLGN